MQALISAVQMYLEEYYGEGWDKDPSRPNYDDMKFHNHISEVLQQPGNPELLRKVGLSTLVVGFLDEFRPVLHGYYGDFDRTIFAPELAALVISRPTFEKAYREISEMGTKGSQHHQELQAKLEGIKHFWDKRAS